MTREETVTLIARNALSIETLELRGRDSLDFHELLVTSIKRALFAAYDAGVKAAKEGAA
jgi:hypothetical protein